jgi:hypothetical protein
MALLLFLRHGVVQHTQQTFNVVLKSLRAHIKRLTAAELDEAGRELLAARHGRALDEDRDDADVPLQGGFNLATDEVVRVVEAPPAAIINTYPAWAYHDEHYVAGRNGTADNFHEIVTRRYGVDIPDDVLAPEVIS